MNHKGFTLIELLATLTIFAILTVIVVPNVFSSINRSKQSAYENQVETIINGAKNYYADHAELLPNSGSSSTVTVGTLKTNNYIDKEIENPKTGETFKNTSTVKVTNTEENYKYAFQE